MSVVLRGDGEAKVAFDTAAVANYILELAERDGLPVTPLKLQKLLYFAHGWHLALTDLPLLDERVEAWKYGPVVPSIYYDFRAFGSNPIGSERCARALPHPRLQSRLGFHFPMLDDPSPECGFARELIERVWEVYRGYTGLQLSAATHKAGTPWEKTWSDMGRIKRMATDIDDNLIKAHFRSLAGRPPE